MTVSSQLSADSGAVQVPRTGPALEPPPPAFEDAHRQLLEDQRLQFSFEAFTPPEIDAPDWLEPVWRFFEGIAPFLSYVFWAGVAIGGLIIVYMIVMELYRRRPRPRASAKAEAPAPKPEYRPAHARAQALLSEADRLAAEGRYSEAVRVLLHRSIEDIERAFATIIGPSLTAREIGALEPLSPQGRSVFGGIARAVELSLFGGRPLGAEDFARCREAYAGFALQGAKR
jgi:hypothetical protein